MYSIDQWLSRKNDQKNGWKQSIIAIYRCTRVSISRKRVRFDFGQSRGSWGVFLTWFQGVPVFDSKRTGYTLFCEGVVWIGMFESVRWIGIVDSVVWSVLLIVLHGSVLATVLAESVCWECWVNGYCWLCWLTRVFECRGRPARRVWSEVLSERSVPLSRNVLVINMNIPSVLSSCFRTEWCSLMMWEWSPVDLDAPI